jgi:hypothetical protein
MTTGHRITWDELPTSTREGYIDRLLAAVPDKQHMLEIAQAMAERLTQRCDKCRWWLASVQGNYGSCDLDGSHIAKPEHYCSKFERRR